MKFFKYIIFSIAAIMITGFAAVYIAGYLAPAGVFGSCFEGGCAYGAVFVGFPIVWITLLAIALSGYLLWRPIR
ncbi:hypothetical protein C9E81_12570 [Paracoccus alkanivorans]|uniref:Uncharacterized protein n=1 Tax=Paracoccus alkanivorans TaxID=2116655 RepID=A0A3M0MUD8_9RHOB|nr:hypothetical protein C9E81_12570 [Paracoccus alkanivorans]